jgi:hypothetical protein
MIELNDKTKQDFLDREWVERLLEAGVDMCDAKYCIVDVRGTDVVCYNKVKDIVDDQRPVPTYTISELLFKLHEFITPTIDGVQYRGELDFIKDAPFYVFFYHIGRKENRETVYDNDEYLYGITESPIESLASLLIQCHKKDIGNERKCVMLNK